MKTVKKNQCENIFSFYFQSLCENSFDTDSSISAKEARINLQWTQVLNWFKVILLGKAPAVTKKINIVHILGSVTVS